MSKKPSFVEEMRARRGKPREIPAARAPWRWSAPIVDPAKNRNTNFQQMHEAAPKPALGGALAAPSTHLAETRGMVAEARAAKRKAYK